MVRILGTTSTLVVSLRWQRQLLPSLHITERALRIWMLCTGALAQGSRRCCGAGFLSGADWTAGSPLWAAEQSCPAGMRVSVTGQRSGCLDASF